MHRAGGACIESCVTSLLPASSTALLTSLGTSPHLQLRHNQLGTDAYSPPADHCEETASKDLRDFPTKWFTQVHGSLAGLQHRSVMR